MLDPVSVALKFGFIVVLYLFLVWVVRSSGKDLRAVPNALRGKQKPSVTPSSGGGPSAPEATSMHRIGGATGEPRLVVERAPGHTPGMEYDVGPGALIGRGDQAEIRLDDPHCSSQHARLVREGGVVVLEDLGSTNGTYLNEELLGGPTPLHEGDRVRIGDSEFTFQESCCCASPTPACSAGRTRTPSSPARRCSPSPTAWAAPRPARSPPALP
jgi:hypothetical protein